MEILAQLGASFWQATNPANVIGCAQRKYSSHTPERVKWFQDQTDPQLLSSKEASKQLK